MESPHPESRRSAGKSHTGLNASTGAARPKMYEYKLLFECYNKRWMELLLSVIVVPYKRAEAGSCCAMNWSCVFFPPFLCSFATNVVLMFCLRSGECEGGVEVECRTERSCVACGGVDRLPWWTHCRWPRRSCTAYEWQCSKWHKWAGTLSFELMFGWG